MQDSNLSNNVSLNKLNLFVTYRSDSNNILNEFYIPCLKNSILYKRAVGYFTSKALAEASRGLVQFIKNGGRMQLIASPILNKEDIELMKKGYELRGVIEDRLKEGLFFELNSIDEQRVKNLTWMIQNNLLEIKIAIPYLLSDNSVYHEKIGIFLDNDNPQNMVAFSGSANETYHGLVSNYESIDVSISWDSGKREVKRAYEHNEHFNTLWNGLKKGVLVSPFPEAVKKELLTRFEPNLTKQEPDAKRILYNFQEVAVNNWEKANFRGIYAMATGSGKTFTAIKSMEILSNVKVVIILVPSIDLGNQWEAELKLEYNETYEIRKAFSGEKDWEGRIKRLLDGIKYGVVNKRIFIISTLQTASKPRFINLFRFIDSTDIALIVDEVHRAGAQSFKSVFKINAGYRLGLSATPERSWDEEGNQEIFNYFGPSVYEYYLEDAIRDGRLSPYEYYMHVVSLTIDERNEFKIMSQNIASTLTKIFTEYPNCRTFSIPKLMQYLDQRAPKYSSQLRTQYLERVELIKTAQNKTEALRKILKNYKLKRCLIYANDLTHLKENIAIVHEQGYIPLEYSSNISSESRKKILDDINHGVLENVHLVAVKCLDEGIDIPAVDSAIFISSSRSEREFIQRRGRVLRKHESKEYSTIHDIVVLPFSNEDDAYPITKSEYNYVEQELNRVKIFSNNSLNKLYDISQMLNFYKNYLLI